MESGGKEDNHLETDEKKPINIFKDNENECDSDNIREVTTFQYVITRLTFLLFFLGDLLMVPLVSEYIMYRTALEYNRSDYATVTNQHQACVNDSEEGVAKDPEWDAIQKMTSSCIMHYNIAELLPCVPAVLLLGAWSDAARRRVPMLMSPAIGNFICATAFVLDFYIKFDSFVAANTSSCMNSDNLVKIIFSFS